jgi:peroxiredoxin
VRVGEPFPDVLLQDVDGHARRLSEYWSLGPTLVVMGHSGCDTTRFTLPHAERLHSRRAAGASVVVVLQDTPDAARAQQAKYHLTVPILLEADPYPLAAALALEGVPTLYLVGKDGRVQSTSDAFRRAAMEGYADALGVPAPLYGEGEKVPALRPG